MLLVLLLILVGCSRAPDVNTRHLCFSCDSEGCYLVGEPAEGIEPLTKDRGGIFEQGEIDLTGDGIIEQVQHRGEQAVIIQDRAEAWRSPSEWRVVDLALGDPNDDGRSEILLAFWKSDDEGVARSHPFIVGHRRGDYCVMWGGSAVDVPIVEVEIADVDGDRVEELVVLEQADGDLEQTVAVWRWNQWWFNLVWRCSKGAYRDLRLVAGDSSEQRPMICVTTE
jgi:hypothetical protein